MVRERTIGELIKQIIHSILIMILDFIVELLITYCFIFVSVFKFTINLLNFHLAHTTQPSDAHVCSVSRQKEHPEVNTRNE